MSGSSGGNVCHRLVCQCHSLSKALPGMVVVGGPALSPLKKGGVQGVHIYIYICKHWVFVRMYVHSAAFVCVHAQRCVCVCVWHMVRVIGGRRRWRQWCQRPNPYTAQPRLVASRCPLKEGDLFFAVGGGGVVVVVVMVVVSCSDSDSDGGRWGVGGGWWWECVGVGVWLGGWVAAVARGLQGQVMRVTQDVRLYMRVLYSISLVFLVYKHHHALGSSAKSSKLQFQFDSTT